MKNILGLLRKSDSTLNELLETQSQLPSEVEIAKECVADLKAQRRRALIDGTEKDVEALDKELVLAERDVDRIAAAIEELSVRITDAEKNELATKVANCHSAAIEDAKTVIDTIDQIDQHAFALSELLLKQQEYQQRINQANSFLSKNGRSDLHVQHPMDALRGIHGGTPNPQSFTLPGYFPNMHPDGRVLSRIKEIKV